MSDLAKPKRGRKQNWSDPSTTWETGTGEFDLAGTIDERECAGEKPTQYEAPKDRKWKARNLVTIHWKILASYECPYPSMVPIFACLIDHANINTGRCDASQKVMAIETGYNVKTVRRVLGWLAENTPFLEIERRVGIKGKFRSNAYHVQWDHMEVDWIGVQVCIEDEKNALRDESMSEHVATMGHQGGTRKGTSRGDMDRVPSRGDTNHEYINHEEEPRHEMVRSPSVTVTGMTSDFSEGQLKEKGIQERGEVESLSTNSQPPAEPNVYKLLNLNAEKLEAAAAAVEADLSALPIYLALLGWPELEFHLGEAAAAELNARGSGAKLILTRFVEGKATGT